MDEQSAKLSHSISRLLGTADGEVHEQTEDSELSMVSNRAEVKEGKRLCGQDECAQPNNKCEHVESNSHSQKHGERRVYPWMTFKRSSKAKKKRSKRIFVVYRRISFSQCLVNRDVNKTV